MPLWSMDTNNEKSWAAEQLAHADAITSNIQSASSKRAQIYLVVWAVFSVLLVLSIGILDRAGMIAAMVVWAVAVGAGAVWSRRWGTIGRETNAQIRRGATGWAVVYAVVIACGAGADIQSLWFWIAGSVATAVPLLVAARTCARCNNVQPSASNGSDS